MGRLRRAVLLVCIVRSVLIGRVRWSRGAAPSVAIGAPLVLAVISIALALTDDESQRGSGGTAGPAVLIFPLIALVVGGLGAALSNLPSGEFRLPRH